MKYVSIFLVLAAAVVHSCKAEQQTLTAARSIELIPPTIAVCNFGLPSGIFEGDIAVPACECAVAINTDIMDAHDACGSSAIAMAKLQRTTSCESLDVSYEHGDDFIPAYTRRCIADSECDHEFTCPHHAYPKPASMCVTSFKDCECSVGFVKKDGECVQCFNNFYCPDNSFRKHNRKCYDSFDDCKCKHGYEKFRGRCIEKCYPGYERNKHGACVEVCKNDFHCPANSFRKHDRKCYDSFDDCKCEHGYEKFNGHCIEKCYPGYERNKHGVCVEVCTNDFHCPANSFRKHDRKCYDSFDDCECEHGYEKSKGRCVKECHNDFHCPKNSFRKHNRKCYDSFDDCECMHGFVKRHGQCKFEDKYNCFTRESWSHEKRKWCCEFKNLGCEGFRLRH